MKVVMVLTFLSLNFKLCGSMGPILDPWFHNGFMGPYMGPMGSTILRLQINITTDIALKKILTKKTQ